MNGRDNALANQQAAMMGGPLGGGLHTQYGGLYQRELKDPSIADAQDAIAALRKRLDVIKSELAKVPRLQAEQARIERMLAAAAPEQP